MRNTKIFELKNILDVQVYSEKSLVFTQDNKGKVVVLMVDYNSERTQPFGFTKIDECDFFENPHGNLIDNEED